MNPDQTYWWRVGLELKLRKLSGVAFQDFFADLMTAAHGDDFVRIRPHGALGDKGCDGYLASSGRVHACYGAVNGDGARVSYLIGKMESDFTKAKTALGGVMKEWVMTHNLVDGLPIEAVQKLDELKKANPQIRFSFAALESMESSLLSMPEAKIIALVGPAALPAANAVLDTAALKELIDGIMSGVDGASASAVDVKTVSAEKLDHNKLPAAWRQLLTAGMQNSSHVDTYFSRHPQAMMGEHVAQRFRERYAYLRSQELAAPAIMANLFEMIVGAGLADAHRVVAAQALLAHLFESCDVLEDAPQAVAS